MDIREQPPQNFCVDRKDIAFTICLNDRHAKNRPIARQGDEQGGLQLGRQADRQASRQANRQADRQVENPCMHSGRQKGRVISILYISPFRMN